MAQDDPQEPVGSGAAPSVLDPVLVDLVNGRDAFADDIATPHGTLHCAPGFSPIAAGRLSGLHLSLVREAPGVVAVLEAADIPGVNDWSPRASNDEPIIVEDKVGFHGQVIFLVVAESHQQARAAARLAKVAAVPTMPVIDVDDAASAGRTLADDYGFQLGEVQSELDGSARRVPGELRVGGQDPFSLETQVVLAEPRRDGSLGIFAASQHPTELRRVVARMLGWREADVAVTVPRLGGGFGGKLVQAIQWAALTALAASKTGRPCKLRLDRDDDMTTGGKRFDFRVDYTAGVAPSGLLKGVDIVLAARCGHAAGHSAELLDQTALHLDNAYFYPAARIATRRMRTNTASAAAVVGMGTTEGMLVAERVMDHVAYALGLDPLDVRLANMYGGPGRDRTPYGVSVAGGAPRRVAERLAESCDYRARRAAVARFNSTSPILRKGLALTLVKYGVPLAPASTNQADASVQLHRDGSVLVAHGGVEMGQGLNTVVMGVVAAAFGINADWVRVASTSTDRLATGGPTFGSVTTELVAGAVAAACETIKDRLFAFIEERWQATRDQIAFRDGYMWVGERAVSLSAAATAAFEARVPLSAAGHQSLPIGTWDRAKKTGQPFASFVHGAACAEVTIDTMTGEMRLDRVDVLQEAGRSRNAAIDHGLIVGGFAQGFGWLTSEELVWDSAGKLLSRGPETYKVPGVSALPSDFRVETIELGGPNAEAGAKPVGDASAALAISVFSALTDAIAGMRRGSMPRLDAPATPESILRAIRSVVGAPV